MDDDVMTQMSTEQAWAFLADQKLGRLAYNLFGDIGIAPLNHVVTGEQIVFRTAEGNKLLGLATAGEVAYEVDAVGDGKAWSVVARGNARELEGHEAEAADELPLKPWLPTLKYHYIAIDVTEISGREFVLGEEPERTFGVY